MGIYRSPCCHLWRLGVNETWINVGHAMDNRTHILVVDDDELVLFTLSEYLTEEGFRVSEANTCSVAHEFLEREKVDLIILDIRMPGEDGLSLIKTIRPQSQIPIIFLTGRDSNEDKVVGLELGADDYITKPFNNRELLARVNSVLRRSGLPPEDPPKDNVRTFAGWTLDLGRRGLTSPEGEAVKLTRGEFELLSAFVKKSNHTLTRDHLLDMVSSRQWAPLDRTIDVMVRKLRKKIEKDPSSPKMFITVHGVGYMFVPDDE